MTSHDINTLRLETQKLNPLFFSPKHLRQHFLLQSTYENILGDG